MIYKAFYKSLPVMVGYVFIGFGFGMLLKEAGFGLGYAILMSALIYAGSMQYVGVSLLAGPASIVTTFLTTLLINARHIFYSISMTERYKHTGAYKPYLLFALTDETFALLSEEENDTSSKFYFWVSFFNQIYWIAGTALGSMFASALPFDMSGIEFSMTALFVSAYTEQFFHSENKKPALIGLGCSFLCLLLLGADAFLIPSMILIVVVLMMQGEKHASSFNSCHGHHDDFTKNGSILRIFQSQNGARLADVFTGCRARNACGVLFKGIDAMDGMGSGFGCCSRAMFQTQHNSFHRFGDILLHVSIAFVKSRILRILFIFLKKSVAHEKKVCYDFNDFKWKRVIFQLDYDR